MTFGDVINQNQNTTDPASVTSELQGGRDPSELLSFPHFSDAPILRDIPTNLDSRTEKRAKTLFISSYEIYKLMNNLVSFC